MAATTQLALPTRAASPLALWHLLSLDAPTVAALWTLFLARASGVHLPIAAPAAMALAVWILYAADRILDARILDGRLLDARSNRSATHSSDLEARHYFHHCHRRAFLIGIAFTAALLATLLPRLDPTALRLYLAEGVLLAAWFLILHATPSAHRLPKEIAVGLFFSAAVFIPTIARAPALRPSLVPAAILLAALCSLNCLFIYKWEHTDAKREHPSRSLVTPNAKLAHATTRLALAHLSALTITLAIAAAALALLHTATPRPIPAAIALSTVFLLALDRSCTHLVPTHLRAAADLALLTPLLLLPFTR